MEDWEEGTRKKMVEEKREEGEEWGRKEKR